MGERTTSDGMHDSETAVLALGRIPIAGQPLEAVLEQIARVAKDNIPGVDEASVTLLRNGKPRTVAFTGQLAIDLDERQYRAGYGPCLDAAISGETITIADTSAETAYRDFAQDAVRHGVRYAMSAGLPIGTTVVGGLNLYGLQKGLPDDRALELIGTFTGYAGVAVANAAAMADAVEEAAGLRTAMQTRAVIEQAKGVLMRDQRCTPEEAFRMLVQASNTANRKLRDVATSIVDSARY